MSTLPCFTPDEAQHATELLALQVARMMGRKMEEDDWTSVYLAAKGFPPSGWSNLKIDVTHDALGVEHKMLNKKNVPDMAVYCGTTQMHPALTRSIRIDAPVAGMPEDELRESAVEQMRSVLMQYANLVDGRRAEIAKKAGISSDAVDLRIGWLLWEESLRQFLYFEEPMNKPDPDNYTAEWNAIKRSNKSQRKPSTNLWIFEKETSKKRYSVTTSAGAKIQPYFDIPAPSDPNLFNATVIGEHAENGLIRMWVQPRTKRLFLNAFSLNANDAEAASSKILDLCERYDPADELTSQQESAAAIDHVYVSDEAYSAMCEKLQPKNDDHALQLLIELVSD